LVAGQGRSRATNTRASRFYLRVRLLPHIKQFLRQADRVSIVNVVMMLLRVMQTIV
jgi:hypothetical protein